MSPLGDIVACASHEDPGGVLDFRFFTIINREAGASLISDDFEFLAD